MALVAPCKNFFRRRPSAGLADFVDLRERNPGLLTPARRIVRRFPCGDELRDRTAAPRQHDRLAQRDRIEQFQARRCMLPPAELYEGSDIVARV